MQLCLTRVRQSTFVTHTIKRTQRNLYGVYEPFQHPPCIQVTLRAFFGRPGQWFEDNDLDGDKNSIFHDLDGSVSGYPDVYVVRADNFLLQHRDCVKVPQWNGCVCSGRYAQVSRKTRSLGHRRYVLFQIQYRSRSLIMQEINKNTVWTCSLRIHYTKPVRFNILPAFKIVVTKYLALALGTDNMWWHESVVPYRPLCAVRLMNLEWGSNEKFQKISRNNINNTPYFTAFLFSRCT